MKYCNIAHNSFECVLQSNKLLTMGSRERFPTSGNDKDKNSIFLNILDQAEMDIY